MLAPCQPVPLIGGGSIVGAVALRCLQAAAQLGAEPPRLAGVEAEVDPRKDTASESATSACVDIHISLPEDFRFGAGWIAGASSVVVAGLASRVRRLLRVLELFVSADAAAQVAPVQTLARPATLPRPKTVNGLSLLALSHCIDAR